MRTTPFEVLSPTRAAALLFTAVVVAARVALAFVEVTGPWDVTWNPPGQARICILTQAAPDLVIDCDELTSGMLTLPAFTVTATIDANTGVFSYAGPADPETGCPGSTIDGTVDPSSTSFTGTAHFFGFQPGFGCVNAAFTLSAVRSACGNGSLDAGEACDDGNNVDGDCTCGRFCNDAEGAACDDGVFCNGPDHCSGGTCSIHAGDPCTGGPCADNCNEDADTCFEPAGTRLCAPCEACNGLGVCVPAPIPSASCKQSTNPARSSLTLKQKGGGKDQLRWKFLVGHATDPSELGDPTTTEDYDLCVFGADGPNPVEVYFGSAPHSGVGCTTCWKRLGNPPGANGVKYKYGGAIDGLQSLAFKPGPFGKPRIAAGAGGPSLHLGAFTVPLPVRVQLLNSSGGCWEGTFSSPSVNDGTRFKAKGD
jgi:hypothetical protein